MNLITYWINCYKHDMESNEKEAIEKIYQFSQQNPEFDMELRKRLKIASANSVISEDERINQIYEYCIEKIIRQQAKEFYLDFPLKSIVSILEEDFVRMELFHRKDNFGDFCLSLYQQIECITNKLCENSTLTEITEKMWGDSAYVKVEKDKDITIDNRAGEYNIASLIFTGQNRKTGLPYFLEKSKVTLQNQYASDKIRIIVYFLGYKAMMKSSDFESYKEITSLLKDLYQCRNMNHRGNTLQPWEQDTIDRVMPLKSFYYFKFLGVLAQYIEFVKNGIPFVPTIKQYCDTFTAKKVPTTRPIGKIELKDDGKKRIR